MSGQINVNIIKPKSVDLPKLLVKIRAYHNKNSYTNKVFQDSDWFKAPIRF